MGNRYHASLSFGLIALVMSAFAFSLFTPSFTHAASAQDIRSRVITQVCERHASIVARFSHQVRTPAVCAPTPIPEPTLTFSGAPITIEEGEDAGLSWSTTHATSCTASGGWSGAKSVSGEEEVSPDETTTYTLTCTGAGGSVAKSVTITVTPAPETPTVDITADPLSITAGGTSAISWTSTNTTSCTASNAWSGDRATSGSENVTPGVTSTYAISCTGPGGTANDSVTVTVIEPEPDAPTLTLSASRAVVNEGSASDATTTLTWDSANADACTASGATEWGGAKSVDGTEILTPTADATYELDCTGAGGSVHAEVTIDFVPTPVPTEDHLLISEVHYDVASTTISGSDAFYEWVEIYNPTAGAVNLQGWFVGDASSTDNIAANVSIAAGGFVVVVASATPSGIPHGVPVIVLGSSIGQNGFANSGDGARLLNPAEVLVDSVGYGTNMTAVPNVSIPEVTDGHSIRRVQLTDDTDTAADWADTSAPTPGA